MNMKWRNDGAPFTTETGVQVGRGDVFAAPHDGRTVKMRRHKLSPMSPKVPVTVGPDPSGMKPRGRFPGVNFGSDRAYEVARDADPPITVTDLRGIRGSGENGAILVGDVRSFIGQRKG